MNIPGLHSADDLHWKQWLLLGSRASGLYTNANIMTPETSDIDLLNNLELKNDLDLDFQ